MKESQYIEEYLRTTRTKRYTIGTFLHYALKGKAKRYTDVYHRALQAAVNRRVERGEVVAVDSILGQTSYVYKQFAS